MFRALLVSLLGIMFTGCGYVGDPLPPALNIPVKITDVRAVQRGDRILIDFTIPELTTEGLAVSSIAAIDLRIGTATDPFNADQWAASAKPIVASSTLGSRRVETATLARDWTGRDAVIGVRLVNSKGRKSEWSNFAVVPARPPLPVPAALRAELHPSGVRLSWDAGSSEKQQYRIYRSSAGLPEALVSTVDTAEYVDTNVSPGRSYEYRVQSVIGPVESESTTPVSVVVRDIFPPAVPAGVTAVTALNTIELGWERNTDADFSRYRVYRSIAGGPFTLVADEVDNPAYSDKQIESGKVYRYAISAVDQTGNESARSAPVEVTSP